MGLSALLKYLSPTFSKFKLPLASKTVFKATGSPSAIRASLAKAKGFGSADVASFTRQLGKFKRKSIRKGYLNKMFPTTRDVPLKEKIPNFLVKKSPLKYVDKGYSKLLSGQSGTYFKELGQDITHPRSALKRVFSTTKYNVKPTSGGLSIVKKGPISRGASTAFTYGIPAWFAVEPWTAKRFKDSGVAGKSIASITGGVPDFFTRKFLPIMAFNHLSESMAKNKSIAKGLRT